MSFTPTYTFTAGTKARASEVNQNFSDVNSASFADKGATGTFTQKQTFSVSTDSDICIVPGGQPSTNLVAGDMYVSSGDNHLYIYDGALWRQIGYASEGDITAVVAGDGLSGGGTSGSVQLDVELTATSGLSLVGSSPNKTLEVADTLAGDGIAIASKVLGLDLTASGGLTLTGSSPAKTLGVLLATNSGLNLTSGLAVDSSIAGNGLTLTTGVLAVGAGNGISVGSDTVAVNLATNSGLNVTSGLSIDSSVAGDGLTWTTGVLAVGAGTGITVAANAVAVDVGTTANKIVQLNGSAQLPAVDGSLLTGLTASTLDGAYTAGRTITLDLGNTIWDGSAVVDTASTVIGATFGKRSASAGSQGYAFLAKGYISNELTPTYVTYTVDGNGNPTQINEYLNNGGTKIRQVDIVYQADKNPYTVTETGAGVLAAGYSTSVITTYTYASGSGSGQSGNLVSMTRTAS